MTGGLPWTAQAVMDRIVEAQRTLRRMPMPRPRGYRCSFPVPPRDDRDAWLQAGANGDPLRLYSSRPEPTHPGYPSAAEISRMDETLEWLLLIPDISDRRLVLARASGVRWRPLTRICGLTRQGLRNRMLRALTALAMRLNERAGAIPCFGRVLTGVSKSA